MSTTPSPSSSSSSSSSSSPSSSSSSSSSSTSSSSSSSTFSRTSGSRFGRGNNHISPMTLTFSMKQSLDKRTLNSTQLSTNSHPTGTFMTPTRRNVVYSSSPQVKKHSPSVISVASQANSSSATLLNYSNNNPSTASNTHTATHSSSTTYFHQNVRDREKCTTQPSFGRKIKNLIKDQEGSIALLAIFIILGLLLCIIIGGLLLRPIFTSGLLLATSASLVFVLTESKAWGPWHHHREAENRYWIFVGFILSSTVVFAPDSPLCIGYHYPFIGMILVLATAFYVHYYDRKLEREELARTPHMRRVSSFVLSDSLATKQKLQIVQDSLAALDYKFVVAKALSQKEILQAENDIIQTLEEASTEELNYIVTNINLPLLFYKVKDKDVLAWMKNSLQHRTRVLQLLSVDRLHELAPQARVVVLDALMNMRLKAHTQSEEWVKCIMLGTTGRNLTRLKTDCDLKGKAHNLHKLIFRDITSDAIRNEILSHINHEAQLVLTDGLRPSSRRKVLSDVDDTLFSSGGHFPAGIDLSYAHHVLYPGVTTFYKELDLGLDETGEWQPGRQGNLAFLSARPHVYKDKSEKKSYKKFEEIRLMKKVGLHCVPTLLSGSLDSGIRMFRGQFEPMALKKFENFSQYAKLYPEFKFVFIGDNGQGDVRAAELITETHPNQVEACFMHQVQPIHKTPGYVNYATLAKWEKLNIFFFTTYIGAALKAAQLNLIHPSGLRRICEDACAYFSELQTMMTLTQAIDRRAELNADIEIVNEYLISLALEPVPLLETECIYTIGSIVETPFGLGFVVDFRAVQGIYTVELLEWSLSSTSKPRLYADQSQLFWYVKGTPGQPVSTRFGTGILHDIRVEHSIHIIKLTEWSLAAATPITSSTSTHTHINTTTPSPVPKISLTPVAYLQPTEFDLIDFCVGDPVVSQFGYGVVISYRPEDGIYGVYIQWPDGAGAMAYLNPQSFTKVEENSRSRCSIM